MRDVDRWWWTLPQVTAVEAVRRYLEGRAIDPKAVEANGCARAVTSLVGAPECVSHFARQVGLPCLVVALRNLRGGIESVIGRAVTDGTRLKSTSAKGSRRGLPMLCSLAELAITGGTLRDLGIQRWRDLTVVIAEGEIDFLTWTAKRLEAVAVVGIVAGTWTDDLAAAIPTGVRVVIRTDPDAAGDRFATTVAESLGIRVTLLRGGRHVA